jgi:hypothetical protein
MALHVNLLRDGYEEVAERIAATARARRGTVYGLIRRDGRVCIEQASCLHKVSPTVWFQVGPYNRGVLVEWVEDDLLQGMRDARREAA